MSGLHSDSRSGSTLAGELARFLWHFTGVVNQDIPLGDQGEPDEFSRYLAYFIDSSPQWRSGRSDIFAALALRLYLAAVKQGVEPRRYIRRASCRAAKVERRTRPLARVSFDDDHRPVPVPGRLLACNGLTPRMLMDAMLLEPDGRLLYELLTGAGVDADQDQRAIRAWLERMESGLAGSGPAGGYRPIDWLRTLATVARPVDSPWRHLKVLVRCIPSWFYLLANAIPFAWILGAGFQAADGAVEMAVMVLSIAGGWWLSDAVSYIVHVERDGWGSSPAALAFQDHHDHPDEAGWWTLRRSIGTTGFITVVPLWLLVILPMPDPLRVVVAVIFWGLLLSAQTHGWAHCPESRRPRWVSWLQDAHILIPVENHSVHHDHLDRSWAICNGWSNRLLDSMGLHRHYTVWRTRLLASPRPIWESQIVSRSGLAASEPGSGGDARSGAH